MPDVRLKPTDAGDPPARPEHFDERYALPLHRVKFLERQNAHPRDERCVFYEEPHIYEIDGQPAQCSVSGLIHPFESEFEPAHGISAMKRSRSSAWPRLAYVHGARRVASVDELATPDVGCLLVDDAADVESVHAVAEHPLLRRGGGFRGCARTLANASRVFARTRAAAAAGTAGIAFVRLGLC